MKLRRYWFKFKLSFHRPHPGGTLMGCGVTACSKDEAIALLSERVFTFQTLPLIEKCIEDVDISNLDANHVRPNMGDPTRWGIWFPLGY
jgi:hypothetical protein